MPGPGDPQWSGFTLIEVLIALLLVSLIALVVSQGVAVATRALEAQRIRNDVLLQAQQVMERALVNRVSVPESSIPGDPFGCTRKVEVKENVVIGGISMTQITVTVTPHGGIPVEPVVLVSAVR